MDRQGMVDVAAHAKGTQGLPAACLPARRGGRR